MKLNIAAIVSPPFQSFMEGFLPELRSYCDLELMVAGSNEEARTLFEAEAHRFDAVVFSGRIFLLYATRNRYETRVPCFAFEDMSHDLIGALYRVLLRERRFDFSRASVDIILSSEDVLGYRDLFQADQQPHCLDESFRALMALDDVNGERLTQKVLNWHLALHRAGKTDLAITRFGAITRELERNGVPYTYMTPTREYVINFFMQTVHDLSAKMSRDPLLGIAALLCTGLNEKPAADLMARCSGILAGHARLRGYDFSFARHMARLEVIMPYRELSELTGGFQTAPLLGLLADDDRRHLCMGLGTGNTLFQARLNASSALAIAGRSSDKVYCVAHNQRVLGPLGQEYADHAYRLEPDARLIALSERYGVDHVVLQQLCAFARIGGKAVLTAEELAQFMDVSRRTANRILTKVTAGGGARIYTEKIGGGKGRPRIRYQLLFV